MLSIIVSSYQTHYFEKFTENVKNTIGDGVEYEIVQIWNPGLMGICKAYNKGAEQAKYDNLLFVHEDVLFHTQNWGKKLIKHLTKDFVGVIGIAGSNYVSKAPIGWYLPDEKHNFYQLIQHNLGKTYKHYIDKIEEVYALDGVFLAITKEKYNKIKFNESLEGFHSYDLDFSLRSAMIFKNYVINDIFIEHFSIGSPNEQWFKNNVITRKKIRYNFNTSLNKSLEVKVFINYINEYFLYNKLNSLNLIKTLEFVPTLLSRKIILKYKELVFKLIRNI